MKSISRSKSPNLARNLGKITSILLVLALAFSIIPSGAGLMALAEESTLVFSDDFNDGTLDSKWKLFDKTSRATVSEANGTLNFTSGGTARQDQRLIYMSDKDYLNQIASVEFSTANMSGSDENYAMVFVRAQDTVSSDAANSTITGYFAWFRFKSKTTFIQGCDAGEFKVTKGMGTCDLSSYANVRMELKAIQKDETTTTLTLSFYDVATGNLIYSNSVEEDYAALQAAGKAGVGGLNAQTLDNFSFYTTDVIEEETLSIDVSDNFDDNTLDSKWKLFDVQDVVTVSETNGKLNFSNTGSNRQNQALIYMADRDYLNQKVSVEFSPSNLSGDADYPMLFVRAQADSSTKANSQLPAYFLWFRYSAKTVFIQNQDFTVSKNLGTVDLSNYANVKMELSATGSSPTVLTASFYDVATGSQIFTASFEDSTTNLQVAGKVGVGGLSDQVLDNFAFSSTDVVEEEPDVPEIVEPEFSGDFTDDFSTELSSDWEWYDNLENSTYSASVADGKLVITSDEDSGSRAERGLLRPEAEAAINQTVRIDFDNAAYAENGNLRPILYARGSVNESGKYTGYVAFVNGKYVLAQKYIDDVWQGHLMPETSTQLSSSLQSSTYSDKRYRMELSVWGSYPTYVATRLYEISDDGSVVALVESNVMTDSTPELQDAGRVGIGSQGGYTVDNFAYTYASDNRFSSMDDGRTLVVSDNFNRSAYNGNNWEWNDVSTVTIKPTIVDGKLKFTNQNNRTNQRLLADGSYINQQVSIEFATAGISGDIAPFVFTRVQDTDLTSATALTGYVVFYKGGRVYLQAYDAGEYESGEYFQQQIEDTVLKSYTNVKLEVNVWGTSPTYVQVNMYDAATGNKIYESEAKEDSYAALQNAGKAGIGAWGNFTVDNFTYTTTAHGDVNGDNEIDARDLVRYKKYLVDDTITIDNIGARIDDDDSKNNALDLAALRRKIINF